MVDFVSVCRRKDKLFQDKSGTYDDIRLHFSGVITSDSSKKPLQRRYSSIFQIVKQEEAKKHGQRHLLLEYIGVYLDVSVSCRSLSKPWY